MATWTWTNTGSGVDSDWTTTPNWNPGTSSPSGATSIVNITGAGSNDYTIEVGLAGTAETVSLGANSVLTLSDGHATIKIGSTAAVTDSLLNNGTLVMSAGTISLGGTAVFESNFATLNGGVIMGYGTIGARNGSLGVWNFGTSTATMIEASQSGSTLFVNGASATFNDAKFKIDSGAILSLGSLETLGTTSSSSHAASVDFNNGNGALILSAVSLGNFFHTSVVSGVTIAAFNGSLSNMIDTSPSHSAITLLNVGAFASATGTIDNSGTITIREVVSSNTIDYVFGGGTAAIAGTLDFHNTSGTISFDVICYAGGTHILTDRGEILVEDIAEGDLVVTMDGDQQVLKPVKWLGHRHINLAAHRNPEQAAPIRFRRGALGENLPHRDLVVSPDHGMLIDGKLIPAKLLINGMTITQERQARSVTYYHVELEQHAMLLAEGVAAESYLDTGNRAFFANAGLALVLHPEFTINENLKCWQEDACMPLTVAATAVEPVWRALADRAASLGYAAPERATTSDADLHLVVDGKRLRPVASDDTRHVFMVPAGASDIRLASRSSSPWEKTPYLDDPRRLGVAVSRIIVRSDDDYIEVPADHPALAQGWHTPEQGGQSIWRWTDGNAALPIIGESRPLMIEVHFGGSNVYLLPRTEAEQRLVA